MIKRKAVVFLLLVTVLSPIVLYTDTLGRSFQTSFCEFPSRPPIPSHVVLFWLLNSSFLVFDLLQHLRTSLMMMLQLLYVDFFPVKFQSFVTCSKFLFFFFLNLYFCFQTLGGIDGKLNLLPQVITFLLHKSLFFCIFLSSNILLSMRRSPQRDLKSQ